MKGTRAESVLYHEMGHLFQHVHGINAREIAETEFGIVGMELNDYLAARLSEYAGNGYNLDEVVAETFSAHYGNVANETAERVARRCGLS